ncbi:hypothetical protein CAPTEDRAFT_187395 [Capitella teleta]|uniref:THAP-type domain-containing protein n=1 Tax=Capitella teleta TaxID=283909 RepID=R7TSM9_CAPTE|nr:hypothetical protein CAPTEDRAFT_187395 [Capitella teleta]|eukprot:ELT96659.1 hypothetical protein CAPTEDRAFT_187395 [Capitella teleta]
MKSRKHLYICSRHFEEKCIVQGKKCHLVHGSMPTKFLPVSSHSNAVKPRKEPSFREPPVVPERVRYLDFEDFRKTTAHNVPASWLVVLTSTTEVALWHEAAQLRFQVDAAFNITLKDGIRSTTYDVGLKETGLNTILRQLISSAKCCGMAADQIKSHLTPADVSKIVPLGERMHASSCSLLATDGGQMCGQCAAFSQVVDARRASADTTLHKNTPLWTKTLY